MNETPKEQPKPQPQQPEKMPPIRKLTPEERGRQNGDGKKKKATYKKASRIHLTEEQWDTRLPGNR
jgi:hypothetical protein